MRLVLREKKLREEKIGDKFYLYHATVTKPDLSNLHSFRKGISSGKSVGMAASQGKGFYLFQKRSSAVTRLTSDTLAYVGGIIDPYAPFEKERDGYRLLVTISTDDLNPALYDIDNEVSFGILIGKIIENFDKIEKMTLPAPMIRSPVKQGALRFQHGTSRATVDANTEGNKPLADALGANCKAIESQDPQLWLKIEREMFASADTDAIKYVGPELIMPEKLEILTDDGKLIDVTTRDP